MSQKTKRTDYAIPEKIDRLDPRWDEIWRGVNAEWERRAAQIGVGPESKPRTLWIDVTPDGLPFPRDDYNGPEPPPWSACKAHPIWPHESMKRRKRAGAPKKGIL